MTFLYGNHITKGGLARISEGVPQYGGVIIYNMHNVALGYGVAAKSTDEIRALDAAVRVFLLVCKAIEYCCFTPVGCG